MFQGSYFIIAGMPNFNRNLPINASFMFDNTSVGGDIIFRNICFNNVYNMFNNMGNPYRPIPGSIINFFTEKTIYLILIIIPAALLLIYEIEIQIL